MSLQQQGKSMKSWGSYVCGAATLVLVAAMTPLAIANDATGVTPEPNSHPLSWAVRYATTRFDHIRENVRDYSCRLIKRERIEGELQEYQFARLKVRCEQRSDGQVVQPMAVFMQYLAPAILKDRRVLYVAGQHNGEALVRKGGSTLKYLKLSIDPHGAAARRESNYPITEIGLDKIMERLIQRIQDDIANDPTAVNTEVSHFRNAKVNDRVCTHIRVVHPERGDGFKYHRASLYVDDELHVPIRLVVEDWPQREGEKPVLIEEYTYADLKLNVGLTDADFHESNLDSTPNGNATASR